MEDSLLIRSAESLGRMIGSLQRQLDAARRVTLRPADTVRGNGHAPGRERTGNSERPKTKRPAKTLAARTNADDTGGREPKRAMKKKPATKRAGAKRRAAKSKM
jgi:hypothetical protein